MRSLRRVLALASTLVTSGALLAVAVQQPAAAAAVTLTGTIRCQNVNYYGDTTRWYPNSVGMSSAPSGPALSPGELVAVPYPTYGFRFTRTLPNGATSVAATALCSSGHSPYGDWSQAGGSIAIPAWATSATIAWSCYTAPVNPGPWMTTCSVESSSFS
ncbi:hypothetical protein [Sphaerisporangium rubeum]|uniref:Ig-like domain-containing protein n=1 Tax=Sphaerisporangium rubeum TaxID=321317 RepID=A0A7X0IAH2_9ACTN|nr:hypothetical protein [Sphaerisporangium rubeum]MBB6470874.1 hypothetical protein [Sphaerisporangium rubeum]